MVEPIKRLKQYITEIEKLVFGEYEILGAPNGNANPTRLSSRLMQMQVKEVSM